MLCRLGLIIALGCSSLSSFGQSLEFVSFPAGYAPGSIELPRSFAGSLAVDPLDETRLYASLGAFGDNDVARIHLDSGSVEIIADGPFGNVAGIAVLSATQLVLVDNGFAAGGPPDQTLLLAQDLDDDGDFDDPGEIGELIAPILTGFFGFSGAQADVVPSGNPQGLPSGALIVQTADGGGEGELLVVADPLGTPEYFPVNDAFFTGFDFNGGFDFDSLDRLIVGSATVVDPTAFVIAGQVYGVLNTNLDQNIDGGESSVLIQPEHLPNGISDLALDGADVGYCTTGGEIKTFPIPFDVLNETSTPSRFATTNSGFLSAVALTSKVKPFQPFSGPDAATMVIGSGFGETNLLTLTPHTLSEPSSSVSAWSLYE